MAIVVNFNGKSIRNPGAYSKTSVNLTGGFPVAPAGIVGIVGEGDAGAPGSTENIRNNSYSPAQFGEVVEKYKSGPIVDAFRLLSNPSNDDRIPNGANQIYIYKTNASTKASETLPSAYGTLESKNYGLDANTISFQTQLAQAEQGPQIAPFSYIPDENTAGALNVRINGGAVASVALPATTTPDAFVTAWNLAVTGMTAGGGDATDVITAAEIGDTLTIAFSGGLVATLTISTAWANTPAIGETVYIPTGSVIAGGGSENVGGYVVTAATSSSLTLKKLADPLVSGAGVGPVAITAATEVQSFEEVTMEYDATTPDGVGASIEISDDSGAVALEELMYGGTDRGMLNSTRVVDGSTLALSIVSGASVQITIDSAFAATAQVGDILTILPGSILIGAANANVGQYLVTAATSSVISCTKFSGTPVAVTATDILAIEDLEVYKGITSNAAAPLSTLSGLEKRVQISLNRSSDDSSEDSTSLGGSIAMQLGYDGTTASCTINSVNMILTVVGGSGVSHTIKLSDFETIQSLVDYIDAQTGYSAAVGDNVIAQSAPSVLDRVSAVGICEENPNSLPGQIKKDSKDIQDFFDNSELVDITRLKYAGLPDVQTSAVFLTGGTKGGSSAASVSAGIDNMKKVRINSLVPLFSRDATDDILDELTEASSNYQISAINAAAKSHCLLMSDTLNRSERNAFCSHKGTFDESKDEAASLASSRISLCIQDAQVLKTDGTLEFVSPWGLASVAAGMQAGAAIGEPMTFKYLNVSAIQHTDFDPMTEADEAIDSGILFADEPDQGGVRMVLGNTTYGRDANFVYNRISVLYAADMVAYNLRQQLESIFVGVSVAIADATSIKNTTISILSTFLDAGIIVGDDENEGRDWKNLNVTISGNVAYLDVTITPAQGIDFVLPSIVLDNIRQTA